jgi:quercetin dioxygenase-like cupin family protein
MERWNRRLQSPPIETRRLQWDAIRVRSRLPEPRSESLSGSRNLGSATACSRSIADTPHLSYSKTNIDELDSRDVDGIQPSFRAVGYELRPSNTRPSVWEFDAGDSSARHRQREQEELYVVLDGRLEMAVEGDTFTVTSGDCILVPPASWRQLTAAEESRVLIIRAPNLADDAIDEADDPERSDH